MFGFAHPWVLAALPLSLLPLWRSAAATSWYSWVGILPRDSLSDGLASILRVLNAVAVGATIIALAAPFRTHAPLERVGQGAEIVVLLDRSRSMDQAYAGSPTSTWWGPSRDTKAKVAQRLLAQFAANRGHDRIGMVLFSTLPIRVVDLTPRPEVVQAAIRAGGLGHGLAETDAGSGLLAALSYFENRPYTGARIILLVSDGGSDIDFETGRRVQDLMKRERVALYWLYLRSYGSPGLLRDPGIGSTPTDSVPEHALQRYFEGMGTPFRAYEAENPEALKRAIDDVNRLANLPIRYIEVIPRSDRSSTPYVLALLCSLALLVGKYLESERWA
ncbi:MAG: putative MxaC protein [Gammaproteobacteria bacterium]|nr:putative MxaC protein [Gammaproteobacteria bacterium]